MDGWDKFSIDEIAAIKKKAGQTLKKKYDSGELSGPNKGRKMSEEEKQKRRQNPKIGGIRKGAGRGKKGWYKGFRCDSTYELAFVIYCLDHNIKFKRNEQYFFYNYENKQYKYYPDFILENGIYIEVKGYLDEKSKEKIKQFKYDLEVYTGLRILQYVKYVKQKYNVNKLTELYEDREKLTKIDKKKILIEQRKEQIRNSGIDFSVYGWITKLKKYLNNSKASKFVMEHMKNELNPYFSHRT